MTDLAANPQKAASPGLQGIYETRTWWVFSGICFIYLFFNWYLRTEILTDQVYYYSLGRSVSADKLGDFLQAQHSFGILSYLAVPITLLVKVSLVSFCLFTGLLLTSQSLPFRTILKIVFFAESAFAASMLLKLLILTFSADIETLGQYETFAPLSLYSFVHSLHLFAVPYWLTYSLQTLDLFQLAYFLMLAAGLHYFMGKPFRQSLKFVVGTYGIGLLCCMIGFAFLTLILSNHS